MVNRVDCETFIGLESQKWWFLIEDESMGRTTRGNMTSVLTAMTKIEGLGTLKDVEYEG